MGCLVVGNLSEYVRKFCCLESCDWRLDLGWFGVMARKSFGWKWRLCQIGACIGPYGSLRGR